MNATDLADMVAPILAVLSKSDYGDIVTVVLDASDANMQGVAEGLRDAGARVRFAGASLSCCLWFETRIGPFTSAKVILLQSHT